MNVIDIVRSILVFSPISDVIHLWKVSKTWKLSIDEKFIIRVIREHYGITCNSGNLKAAIHWLGYDHVTYDVSQVRELGNGNILMSYKNMSELHNVIGEKLSSKSIHMVPSGNEIIGYHNGEAHVFDENGKLVDSDTITNYKKLGDMIYMTKNGSLFGCRYDIPYGIGTIMYKILPNGNYFMHDLTNYCLRDKNLDLIKYFLNTSTVILLTSGFITVVRPGVYGVYDYEFNGVRDSQYINCDSIISSGDFFIAKSRGKCEIFELRDNRCIRLFEMNKQISDYVVGWNRNRHGMFDRVSSLAATEKYVFVGTMTGNIVKMKKDGSVVRVVRLGIAITKLAILKSKKMMISCRCGSDSGLGNEFHVVEIP